MREDLILSHSDRLYHHYRSKGFTEEQAASYISLKLQKLKNNRNDHFEDYSQYFKSRVFDELFRGLLPGEKIVDIGCGSGELIATFMETRPEYEFVGVEPYEDERQIGIQLIQELNNNSTIYSTLDECLEKENIGLAFFFSVTEHLNDQTFTELLNSLEHSGVNAVLILVPNKYKVRDDHTGLPFIGLMPHRLSGAVTRLMKSPYLLSDGGIWDVWYRSAASYRQLLSKSGYRSEFLEGDDIFPPLAICPKVKTKFRSLTRPTDFKYLLNCFVRLFSVKDNADDFPYLNILATRKDA